MEVKNWFLERCHFMVQDGAQTRFWEDFWIGYEPLMTKYTSLYNVARKKNVTVAHILSTELLNISFIWVVGGDRVKWLELVKGLPEVKLNTWNYTFISNRNKTFLVRSMYNDVMTRLGVPFDVSSWKVKVPLKSKFTFGIWDNLSTY
jgi:hypothetical protein